LDFVAASQDALPPQLLLPACFCLTNRQLGNAVVSTSKTNFSIKAYSQKQNGARLSIKYFNTNHYIGGVGDGKEESVPMAQTETD